MLPFRERLFDLREDAMCSIMVNIFAVDMLIGVYTINVHVHDWSVCFFEGESFECGMWILSNGGSVEGDENLHVPLNKIC